MMKASFFWDLEENSRSIEREKVLLFKLNVGKLMNDKLSLNKMQMEIASKPMTRINLEWERQVQSLETEERIMLQANEAIL